MFLEQKNQCIRIISEGPCDSEDGVMTADKSASLPSRNKLQLKKIYANKL